jgi:ATPase subunit of ABC transporter with duplicated ATPase domains
MQEFTGTMIFACHDHALTQTVANRVLEIGTKGYLDKLMTYDEYLEDPKVKEQKASIY